MRKKIWKQIGHGVLLLGLIAGMGLMAKAATVSGFQRLASSSDSLKLWAQSDSSNYFELTTTSSSVFYTESSRTTSSSIVFDIQDKLLDAQSTSSSRNTVLVTDDVEVESVAGSSFTITKQTATGDTRLTASLQAEDDNALQASLSSGVVVKYKRYPVPRPSIANGTNISSIQYREGTDSDIATKSYVEWPDGYVYLSTSSNRLDVRVISAVNSDTSTANLAIQKHENGNNTTQNASLLSRGTFADGRKITDFTITGINGSRKLTLSGITVIDGPSLTYNGTSNDDSGAINFEVRQNNTRSYLTKNGMVSLSAGVYPVYLRAYTNSYFPHPYTA